MLDKTEKIFSNNKDLNLSQPLPKDEIFMTNVIQIPHHINKNLLEEGSSENEEEPDPSAIHDVSSDSSQNSKEKENEVKEIDSIFDFENIVSPKEEEVGDFTIISGFTIESLNGKNKKKKNKIAPKKELQKEEEFEIEEEEEDSDDNSKSWDLLKILVLTKSKKTKELMGNFKHFLSSMIYNYKPFNDKLTKITAKYPINLFDSQTNYLIDINNSLFCFLYMSYRSGFFNMKYLGIGDCTSDSGWGCMLRCCQMMLSRGLAKIRLKEYFKNNENSKNIIFDIQKNVITKIKQELLGLFFDGKINYNQIRSNLYLAHFFQLYQELADIKGVDTNIYEIIPPYSIHTLCYLGNFKGEYTSDVRIIKYFLNINNLLFDSLNMVHFENGHVKKRELIENLLFLDNKKFKFTNVYKFDGKEYIFEKPGLVFISFRLGLQNLDESYYNIITLIFSKIHNNIGFVSGKKNRAYYFIGSNGDGRLIFADPHFCQKVEEKDNLLSYNIPELYLLNVKELSSELTIGVAIFDINDFKIFIEDLEYLHKTYPNFIRFK